MIRTQVFQNYEEFLRKMVAVREKHFLFFLKSSQPNLGSGQIARQSRRISLQRVFFNAYFQKFLLKNILWRIKYKKIVV